MAAAHAHTIAGRRRRRRAMYKQAPRVSASSQPASGPRRALLAGAVMLAVAGGPSLAAAEGPPPTPSGDDQSVLAKLGVSLYGFVELDIIRDSTQSFHERAGNELVSRPSTYEGEHGRLMLSARHTRLGLKLDGPGSGSGSVTTSAAVEMDFLGNQPPFPPLTEASFYQSPTFRLR